MGQPLRPDIDEAFRRLFSGQDWNTFERAAFEYLDANPTDFDAHRKFFEHFTPLWRQLCDARMYTHAEDLWAKAVTITNKWQNLKGPHIHKGTPFYFWGGTALLNGGIDLGFVLIHEAYYEDISAESSGGKPADTLPAWCFVILKDEVQEQYWRPLVKDLAKFLDAQISVYDHDCNGFLDLSHLKTQFLQMAKYREAAFFFVYSLWKFKHHLDSSQNLINSPFSVLLQLDAVLNLYVVLEEILRGYYGYEKTLRTLIVDFSKAHNLDIHRCPPGEQKPRNQLLEERFEGDPNAVIFDVLVCSMPDYTSVQTA